MNVTDLFSQFYSARALPIRYHVVHSTEGYDSRTWLTQTGGVSAHYLVRGVDIYRLVDESYDAWHAGRIVGTPTTMYYSGSVIGYDYYGWPLWSVNPNDESLGIEMEGFAQYLLDPATLDSTAELIRDIRNRRGPLPIVGHYELSPGDRSDPGAQNLAALKELLAASEDEDMTPAQEAKLDRLLALMEARENLVWSARVQRQLDVETGKAFNPASTPQDQRIKT
jgi:N-acetyl-anhydromuramyl-L-alanine amidase AmpD